MRSKIATKPVNKEVRKVVAANSNIIPRCPQTLVESVNSTFGIVASQIATLCIFQILAHSRVVRTKAIYLVGGKVHSLLCVRNLVLVNAFSEALRYVDAFPIRHGTLQVCAGWWS